MLNELDSSCRDIFIVLIIIVVVVVVVIIIIIIITIDRLCGDIFSFFLIINNITINNY